MRLPPFLFLVARAFFGLFLLLTSLYCLLAYVPFTYQHFHKAGLVHSVTLFVRFHVLLYWAAFAAAAATLAEDLATPATRPGPLAFLCFHAGVGSVLTFQPLLPELGNDGRSLVWGLFALVPLLWVAALDWIARRGVLDLAREVNGDSELFQACAGSALYLWLVYTAIAYGNRSTAGSPLASWPGPDQLVGAGSSLLSHLLAAMALFLVLALIAACAARSRAPARAEFLLSSAAAALALAGVALLVFSEVAFQGWQARGVAAALGMAIAAAAAGVGLRIWRPHRRPEGGLAVALAVFSPAALTAPGFLARLRGRRPTGRPSPPPETAAPTVASWRGAPLRVAALVVLAAAAWLLSSRTALVDWNFVLRKLGVLAVWTATFGVFLEAANRGARRWAGQSALMLAAALLVLGAHQGFARWQRAGGGARDAMLEAYSAHNVSFRLLDDALRIPSLGAPFYRFLGENTNLPPATRVQPVDVKLVDRLEPSGRPRPNIFVFLLDSLRRDYLSPYNPAVAFTPRIEAFARESVVLQNAFTRYGGTGLSEPALWTGGLVLHKQYVTPYHPMNALQKLLDADRYRLYLTRGEILDTLLGPSSEVVRLSKDVPEMDFDLCTVTAELEQRLTESAEPGRPVFAYSLPQNLHVAAINREGQSVPAGESYPGFHAPYAARVRRIDACFGRFIDFLKRTGLYDDSIVVLSTDHGDMLGEDGKWGHAYTLSPEVLEIPLILRVPAALTRGLDLDTRTIAFLSDLTPTLYYLLGHRPILRSDVTGRPLFTESAEERNVYLQPSYLVASSYGPVYGLLRNNGTSLYVVDGINFNDRLYDLSRRSPENRQPVTEAMRSESQRLIRDHILELGRFYGFWHPR